VSELYDLFGVFRAHIYASRGKKIFHSFEKIGTIGQITWEGQNKDVGQRKRQAGMGGETRTPPGAPVQAMAEAS
jgi:hypothetical protein